MTYTTHNSSLDIYADSHPFHFNLLQNTISEKHFRSSPTRYKSWQDKARSKQERIQKILYCRQHGYTDKKAYTDGQKIYYVEQGCNHRSCVHCADKVRKKYIRKLQQELEHYENWSYMVIPFRNVFDLNNEYLKFTSKVKDRIFKTLRKKYRIEANVTVVEIVVHEKGDKMYHSFYDKIEHRWKKKHVGHYIRKSYNVHYNIIFSGDFLPQWEVKKYLQLYSGDSNIVNINYIGSSKHGFRSFKKALYYVTKYINKMTPKIKDLNTAIEYYKAIRLFKFVRYQRIKKVPKIKYYSVYKYLRDIYSYDHYRTLEVVTNLLVKMNKFGLTIYDPSKCIEENVFQYADTETQLICTGI